MQSHPLQSVARSPRSAILLVDSLMRLFSLATVDEGIKSRGRSPFTRLRPTATHAGFNPAAQTPFFTPQMAPNDYRVDVQVPARSDLGATIAASLSSASADSGNTTSSSSASGDSSHGCNCLALSLGTSWPSMLEFSPAFASTIRWPEGLAEGDFRREECRRLVWASVMVIGNLHAYIASIPGYNAIDSGSLFVREPENVSVLLSLHPHIYVRADVHPRGPIVRLDASRGGARGSRYDRRAG